MTSPVSSQLPFTLPTPLVSTCSAVKDDMGKSQTYNIPPETNIGMSPRFMLFNAEVYPDPKCFDPSRWLTRENILPSEASGDGRVLKPARQTDLKAMEHSFKRFGGGPRRCIGMNLAYANLYHILAAVLRRFDLEITDTV